MNPDEPQLAISRVLDAPRELWHSGPSPIRITSRPSNQGRLEALKKLDATLLHIQSTATDAEV